MDLLPQGRRGYLCRRAAVVMSIFPRPGTVDFPFRACLSIGSRRTMCGPTIPFVAWSTWTRTSA
eukprot:2262711-Pleurochrysis_carterae.AAC.1